MKIPLDYQLAIQGNFEKEAFDGYFSVVYTM